MRKIYINFKLKNTVHVLSIAKIARIGLFVSLMFAISAPGVYAATYGDTTAYAGNNANEDLILMQVNIPTAGVATMLHPCIQADSGSATIYGGIYSDASGLPGTLLVGPTSTTVSNTTTQFVNIDIPDTVLAAGNYWLAVSLTNTGDDICDNSTSNAAREYNLTTVSSWPSSISGASIGRVGPIGYTIDVSPLTVGTGPAVSSFSDNFTTAQYETADTDYERIKQTGTADLESVGGVLTDGTCGSAVSDGAQYGTINTFTSADYEVSMYIPSLAPTGYHYQLLGRIQNATNYYALHAETGYRVWIGRIDNDAFTTLTSISNTTNLGSGDTLRLKIKGSRIDVIWDDSVKVSTTDTTFSSAGGAGFGMGTFNITTGAGIAGCSSSTQFDNFSVSTTISPDTTTESATNITATTADLRSTVNPNGSSTTVYYRYGTSNTDCSSLPSSGTYGNIGSGTANVSYNALNITGLTPGTTYYFCTYATNSGGTINGSVLSFSTPLSTPVIASPTKSSISYTTVTLGGNITNQGASAVTERGVCYSTSDNTPQLGEGSVTCQASGIGTGVFTADVTGLNANTLYYYRAYATNTQGTSYTSTDNFTTLAIPTPTVSLSAPANLTSNSVRLNASINPQNFSTTGYFRLWKINPYNCVDFGDTVNSFRSPIAGGTNLTGSTSQAYFVDVTGLEANKTYYYCAIGDNGTNKGYHSTTPSSFTTPNGPQTSCDVSPTSAITLSGGSVNCAFPGANNITGADGVAMTLSGGATLLLQSGQTVVFTTISKSGAYINKIAGGVMRKGCIYVKDTDGDGRYDPTTTTFSATCPNAVLAGQGFVRRKDLVGAPSYLSQASECNDTTNTVTATSCIPGGVAPSGVTNLAGSTATLNGSANPNGDAGTRAYFKWGPSNTGDCDTLASSTSASLISGTTSQAFSQGISGLTGGNTYYWCAVVYNNSGTSYGDISSFVALSAPTGISFSGVSQTNITVNWTPPSGAAGFKIYRCTGSSSCTPTSSLATDPNNASPYSDTSVTCGNWYGYQVTATTGAGGTGTEGSKSSPIQYAQTSSCGPVFTIVNSNNGYGTDIAMGSDGFARIAYQDALDNSLKFVQCTNAACTTKNITTVDSIGSHISMKLGSDGYARIAYWDHINDDLKFVQCTNAACTTKNITTVDSTGATGRSPKVDIGSDGYARIAYQYSSDPNVSIKFVQCTNAACTTKNISTVDTFISSGTGTGMALGSDDYARISYRNPAAGLRFVQCTNASCSSKSTTTIDSDTSLGGAFLSVEKGSDGFMRIGASHDTIIKFIQCTNAACTTNANNTVYSDSGILYGSMKLGSDGYGRIGYYPWASQDVKFIQCTNATCTTKNITTVDSTGNTGQGLSSTIGSDGFARIAYRDDLANLKLAICQSASCQ